MASNIQHLDVYLLDQYIGDLSYAQGELNFKYDPVYLHSKNSVKLSASLPLRSTVFTHVVTQAFFSGLLPDEMVRYRLARYLKISEKNTFALLEAIGGECAGAVSLLPSKSVLDITAKPSYRLLEKQEADDILSSLDRHPMFAGEENIRISGAGAQNKLMVAFVHGQIAIPTFNTPSTHIIKPKIQDLEASVFNEFFCMKLAKILGLPVPHVDIYQLNNQSYYLIKRFDRICKNTDNTPQRLHQEDFCQAMQLPPEMKYEAEGGPTLKQCFDLLDSRIRLGVMAGSNKLTLLQGVIYNFIIGNGDAHGKNFSLLYKNQAESLAPFYDLMCTKVYNNSHKVKMAMKLGRKYKFTDISIQNFEQLSDIIGFKNELTKKQVAKLANNIHDQAIMLGEQLNKDPKTQSTIYNKITRVIAQHVQQLQVKK